MNDENFKIDFIGIGASRSGSTWIGQCLKEHPQICFSSIKETNFFNRDENYNKGLNLYKKFFKECSRDQIKGEFTPNYLRAPIAAQRIHDNFPNTKLIVCLRNPIERAYSQYFYNKSKEKETSCTFEQAIDGPLKNSYLGKGNYFTNLQPFINLFPKEKILIMIYEDIDKDPHKFIELLYNFLEIDPEYIPTSITKKINTSSKKEKRLYFPFYNRAINYLKKKNDNVIINSLKKTAKKLGLTSLTKLLFEKNKKQPSTKFEKKPPMNPSTRKYLVKYYDDEIQKLEKYINRDLSFWKL